ncbi:dTDP-4-dehydrorhamnose reductase [Brevibacillus borstelensis]|uniref:dTDP-4-dehydrorhamnose reductase n=1 Tax=Brevibacillus borstelensis TaxID=45462 RepID=UPI0030C3D79F
MKVVITGANGQLAQDLKAVFSAHHEVFSLSRSELDITNSASVSEIIHFLRPDAIVHAAAYTNVDQAESDEDTAYLVNAYGTRNVAVAARQVAAKMVYISTDYVFDGNKGTAYNEFDLVNPLCVYGKSKLAGEEMVKSFSDRYFIVRTSWVFGRHGNNFVKTMLKLTAMRTELQVVNDQTGSPTYTIDLAAFLKELIETEKYGVYHASNAGACTWYEFAKAIIAEAGLTCKVAPIETKDLPRPARRPAYSVLDHMAIRLNGFPEMRHWTDALHTYMSASL